MCQVLSLLHEALSQCGDHYSIEYDGRGGSPGAGQFKRHVPIGSTDAMPNIQEPLGQFKRQLPAPSYGSPCKRRRHSDSGSIRQDVLLLTLPNPRGNMKGSLSLEGEAQQSAAAAAASAVTDVDAVQPNGTSGSLLTSSSSLSSQSSPMSAPISPLLPLKVSQCDLLSTGLDDVSNDSALGPTPPKSGGEWRRGSISQDSECSSVFSDDGGSLARGITYGCEDDCRSLPRGNTGDTVICADDDKNSSIAPSVSDSGVLMRTLTRDSSIGSVMSDCPESVYNMTQDKAGKRRRLWYKHHHFSTPVTDDLNYHSSSASNRLAIRSSSLPDPHTFPLTSDYDLPPHTPLLVSSHSLHPPPIPCESPPLPLITVSSPSASESGIVRNADINLSHLPDNCKTNGKLQLYESYDGRNLLRDDVPADRWQTESNSLDYAVAIDRPSVIRTIASLPLDCKPPNTGFPASLCERNEGYANILLDGQPERSSSATCEAFVPRSSCLKTARRTASDLLEVVSLDQ